MSAGSSARTEYEGRLAVERGHLRSRAPWVVVIISLTMVATFLLIHLGLQGGNNFLRHDFGFLRADTPASRPPRAPMSGRFITLASLGVALCVGLSLLRATLEPSQSTRAWRKGAEGEEAVGRALDRLTHHGYLVRHDLAIPGSAANVDHVVAGPCGLVVIDTKNLTGPITVSRGKLWQARWPIDGRVRRSAWEADQVSRMLRSATRLPVQARAVICVLGARLPRRSLEWEGVVLVEGVQGLLKELRRRGATELPAELCQALARLPRR